MQILLLFLLSFCTSSFAMDIDNSYPYIRYEVPKSIECSEPFFIEAKFISKEYSTRAVNLERFAHYPPIILGEDIGQAVGEIYDKVFPETATEDFRFHNWVLDNLRTIALLQIKSWEDYEKRRQFFYEEFCSASPINTTVIIPEPLPDVMLGRKYLSESVKNGSADTFTLKSKKSNYFQSNVTVHTDREGIVYRVIRQTKPFPSREDANSFREAIIKSLDEKYAYREDNQIRSAQRHSGSGLDFLLPSLNYVQRVSPDNKFQIEMYESERAPLAPRDATKQQPVSYTLLYTYRPIDTKLSSNLNISPTKPTEKTPSAVDTISEKIKSDI